MPLVVGRRDDRLHLRRDQLEGARRQRDRRRDRGRGQRRRAGAAAAARGADSPVWADGPNADLRRGAGAGEPRRSRLDDADAQPLARRAGLADRLCAARDSAEQAAARRRSAAAPRSTARSARPMISRSPPRPTPEDYAELLDDAGLKAQARAPMTPVVKLVFGVDYDKTRLTEFAAALSWAQREGVAAGRARRRASRRMTAASRASSRPSARARRPAPKPDRWAEIRAALQRRAAARPGRHRGRGRGRVRPARRPPRRRRPRHRRPGRRRQADRPGDPQERRLNPASVRAIRLAGGVRRESEPCALSLRFRTRRSRRRAAPSRRHDGSRSGSPASISPPRRFISRRAGRSSSTSSTPAAAGTISRRPNFSPPRGGVSRPCFARPGRSRRPCERRRPPHPGARHLSAALHPHAPYHFRHDRPDRRRIARWRRLISGAIEGSTVLGGASRWACSIS